MAVPWALYCGEINQEFPAPVLKNHVGLACVQNQFKRALVGFFASLHPGRADPGGLPADPSAAGGWKIRGSLAPVTKEQWLAKSRRIIRKLYAKPKDYLRKFGCGTTLRLS